MVITRIYDPANEQANCLNAIADKDATREFIASCYADCMRAGPGIEWAKINAAILGRYKKSGLIFIKVKAYQETQTGKAANA